MPARDFRGRHFKVAQNLATAGAQDPGGEADASDFAGAQSADPTDGFREPLLGSATDPSRADAAGIQGLCPHRSEVPAPALWREALTRLAAVSKAACGGYLGL